MASAPVTAVVVGVALVRSGLLLAAQRAHPPQLAGLWELPGGKVEPGEDEAVALVRECREELGCEITVGARVGGDQPTVDGRFVLRVYAATLAGGEPTNREHRQLLWVGPAELGSLDWLPADRPLLPLLVALLT
jgi:8-oxo-dGTP diphosphatase